MKLDFTRLGSSGSVVAVPFALRDDAHRGSTAQAHRRAAAKALAARVRAAAANRPFFARTNSDTGELRIYELIGDDWWGGGVTAKAIAEALDSLAGVKTLNVFINSEGGEVFEANAIFTLLRSFKARKVVRIDGVAASAASFVAMAGDEIVTASHAMWMIHEAWTVVGGPAERLRQAAELLDKLNVTIAETYAKQTGSSAEEMRRLMKAETWLRADEALKLGLTDEVVDLSPEASAAHTALSARIRKLAVESERREVRHEGHATLSLQGEIGWGQGEAFADLVKASQKAGARSLLMVLDSCGGNIHQGFLIVDALRAFSRKAGPVVVHVAGEANSMAGAIAVAGDYIVSHPRLSRFAFHRPSMGGLACPPAIENKFIGALERRTMLSRGQVQMFLGAEMRAEPEDQLRWGLADEFGDLARAQEVARAVAGPAGLSHAPASPRQRALRVKKLLRDLAPNR